MFRSTSFYGLINYNAIKGLNLNLKNNINKVCSGAVVKNKKQGTKVIKLSKVISQTQLGQRVNVYNGVRWLPILITSFKVGRPYKDFILTKRIGGIHNKLKNKK